MKKKFIHVCESKKEKVLISLAMRHKQREEYLNLSLGKFFWVLQPRRVVVFKMSEDHHSKREYIIVFGEYLKLDINLRSYYNWISNSENYSEFVPWFSSLRRKGFSRKSLCSCVWLISWFNNFGGNISWWFIKIFVEFLNFHKTILQSQKVVLEFLLSEQVVSELPLSQQVVTEFSLTQQKTLQ